MLITTDVLEQMVQAAMAECPREACGILTAGHEPWVYNIYYRMENLAPDPTKYFWLDGPAVMRAIEAWGPEHVAIWHSHLDTPATPSREDVLIMEQVKVPMVIVSLRPEVPQVIMYELTTETGAPWPRVATKYRVPIQVKMA